ncbi:CHAT domain-containing protein [Amycolatopsis sp. DG1A-15b]|uniref:CHAT domain-containing protein n=1 Tax=Amycolatopsis sp. DG1A-15b TaxID=3052846 RepID=UPI00255BD330|nr:CHAT domain-containing protein [Amycolatopsis sp. DG1A-15b]WIX92525.1 CHAT domain-containing protein [Amycolatopsis sp. DG1A-15b]
MDETTMRDLARRLLDALPDVVTDRQEEIDVRRLLVDALARPSGEARRSLRRVFQRESVRPWVSRQRPAEQDEFKLPLGDDRPARYLTGEVLDEVAVGAAISLEVSVTRHARDLSAKLRPFAMPPDGAWVDLALRPGGLTAKTGTAERTFTPPDEAGQDSDPVLFVLEAPSPGVYRPSVRAYVGGKFVGELVMEIVAGAGGSGVTRVHSATLDDLHGNPDEIAIDIAHDGGNHYVYRLYDGNAAAPVRHTVLSDRLLEMLHTDLTSMATRRAFKDAGGARYHLANLGRKLWREAFPEAIKESLLEHLSVAKGKRMTVVSDLHAVPWELLHPSRPAETGGFLAELLPVLRRVSGDEHEYSRRLRLNPAAYVCPPTSPGVDEELKAVKRILGPDVRHLPLIGDLAGLTALLRDGRFGLLHLACHNESSARRWDRVQLGGGPFTPVDLEEARSRRSLRTTRPLVFFNACRTTGGAADTRIDSWAANFLAAGAGAFVGSVWPVRAGTARTYAEAFYSAFVGDKQPLGEASQTAREAIKHDEDPTWLAYAVYGRHSATAIGS